MVLQLGGALGTYTASGASAGWVVVLVGRPSFSAGVTDQLQEVADIVSVLERVESSRACDAAPDSHRVCLQFRRAVRIFGSVSV
jgi:hypothetical protein